MTLAIALLLFASGFLSGAVNAVAGGGTFLTFGALTVAGLPPITANATSSVAQIPGYITSALSYWSDVRRIWRGILLLALASALGSILGAMLLLALDNEDFAALVPWLLLGATAMFAAGPWLKPRRPHASDAATGRGIAGPLVQFVTSIYGGFFGAGMGIMMLATLGLTESGEYHRLNAIKNALSIVIAFVAIGIFVSGGVVAWIHALVMVPAVALGGYAGVWAARRVPTIAVRSFVVAVGLALAAYYFVKG
jgi:uncharacterized protein